MTVQSKLNPVRNTIGFFDSVPYTCYETGHTWQPSCVIAFLDTVRDSFKFSLKVYIAFYTATFLIKLRNKERRNLKELKKLVKDILQSSIFLSANGNVFLGGYCVIRHVMGKLYGWHSLATGLMVGYITIGIERKSRRGMLALYLLNLATELMFKMAVSRNMIKPIANGEVLIFSLASAGSMALFRTPGGLTENLQKSLGYFVGKFEGGNTEFGEQQEPRTRALRYQNKCTQVIRLCLQRLKRIHPKHCCCPHQESCLYYILKGSSKQFLLGYAIEVGINCLQFIRGRTKFSAIFKNFSLASFLSAYMGIFRAVNCILRWLRNKDSPTIHGATAGAIVGISSWFYKSSTISLYFLFKLFEVLLLKTVDKGYLPHLENADKIVYALSLGIILNAAVLEPHNIRPGYWNFLCGVSGNKFPYIFRQLFDVFGTNASTKYPDFVPDLDPKYVKTPGCISTLISNGKWNEKM